MGSNEPDRRVTALLRPPANVFTEACPPFGRLMDIARGGAAMDQERLHLGRGCSYCAMTLRQSFSLACPPDGVTAVGRPGSALAQALEDHAAGCPACQRPASRARASGRPVHERQPRPPVDAGGGGIALRRAPVQLRAMERIERVLDAAERVFVEVGYEAATTNLIAAKAGTSIGSIYEFFGNKQAVAASVADRWMREMPVAFDEVLCPGPVDPGEQLACVVDVLGELARCHPGFGPLLRASAGSLDLKAAAQRFEDEVASRVGEVLATGFGASDPARRSTVARSCVAILRVVFDDVTRVAGQSRSDWLAEVTLMLTAYVHVAVATSDTGGRPSGVR